jgi:mRNA-degrading endonuclease toxin of MazEF toxin-antitoxin module
MNDVPTPYRPLTGRQYRQEVRQGHIYEAPVFYTQTELIIARPLHNGEAGQVLPADIVVSPRDLFSHRAYPRLHLATDEEFILVKAKQRPVVVLSSDEINTHGDSVLVVPLYSAVNYRPEFVQRVQEREYPGFVYLAADADLGRKATIVRFDHLQSVAHPLLIPKPVAVTRAVLMLLLDAMTEHLGLHPSS